MSHNNAAQAADPDFVMTELRGIIGVAGDSPTVIVSVERMRLWLSQLRAPVADDLVASLHSMASVAPTSECEILLAAASALASAPVTHYECGRSNGDGTYAAVPVRAPVAGEAPPTDWQNALRIAELPEADEALAVFCNDGTLDNAVGLVQAILDAAPQASAVDGLPVWWERFMNELTLRSEDEVRNDLAGILEICALDAIASAAPQASEAVRQQRAEVVDELARLREALQFYAHGNHYHFFSDTWDTCSGEPQNFWFDEAETGMIEDGSVARAALSAQPAQKEQHTDGGAVYE